MRQKFKKGVWGKIALVIIATIGIYYAGLAIDIYAYSFKSDPYPADAAIVLGAEVRGGKPTPVFEERIKHAIHLYTTKQVRLIIFTGGVGENDQLSESAAAKAYAVLQGVAAEDILCETSSTITIENLQGTMGMIQSLGLQRVLIVSDPLHMRRSVRMAQDLGMNAYPSPTPTTRYKGFIPKSEFLLRETYLFGMYLFNRLF